MEAAFSVALSFKDRILLVRDNDSVPADEGGSRSESVSFNLGADVGAGPRDVEGIESCEESDRIDGESSVGVEGMGDPRSLLLAT